MEMDCFESDFNDANLFVFVLIVQNNCDIQIDRLHRIES